MKKEWLHSLDAAITICDKKGIIVYMNRKAIESFAKEGGKKLIGTSLIECHPGESRNILTEMLKSGKENIYSIEKNGVKKLIIQKPVHEHGDYAGLMEMSIVIPSEMPHHIRN
jgi:sensor histidine kinase regulating citrate/malate metabolism